MSAIFLLLLFIAYFVSGISRDTVNLAHLSAFTAIAVGFLILFKQGKKLLMPPHFWLYLIFTLILNLYPVFTLNKVNSFNYSLLFTEGAAFWVLFYNLEEKYSEKLFKLVLILASVYAIFYGVSLALNNNFTNLAYHYFEKGEGAGHPQIGNLFALITAYLAGSALSGKAYKFDLIFYLLSLFFIAYSRSRTTLIALGASVIFYFRNNPKAKYIFYLAIPLILVFVLFISSGRSLLASRVYFLQSLGSVLAYPLGVGMGNFREISLPYYNSGGLLGFYSSYAHNIFLEAVSGAGVLSFPFLMWGFYVLKDLVVKAKNRSGWSLLFITLTVIFMIDFFYIIPAMFWLWLSSLGILQRKQD